MEPFVHLHVHSHFSLLDALGSPEALVARAAELEQPALAITDHGVMNGTIDFYQAANEGGIKPIIGLEVYFVEDRASRAKRVERNHLTLLAESDAGYRNLLRISTGGFMDGWHDGKPGVDLELLARHADGVICLTGCLASRSSRRIVADRLDEARAHLDDLVQVFGAENVYLEMQRNGRAEQDKVNDALVRFAADMRRPLVATADVHYLRREDYDHHTALLCVQTKSTLQRPATRPESNDYYLKSADEMAQAFAACASARLDARDRRPLHDDDRAQPPAAPELRVPGRTGRARLPAPPRRSGPARAVRRSGAGGRRRASRHGACGDRPEGRR